MLVKRLKPSKKQGRMYKVNVIKTLEDNKILIEKKFRELDQRRQSLKNQLAQTTEEVFQLQGEYRGIAKLLEEFKEANNKK